MPTETIELKEIYRGFVALRLAACSTVGSIELFHPRQEKGKSSAAPSCRRRRSC
jgi:hypothetical protein